MKKLQIKNGREMKSVYKLIIPLCLVAIIFFMYFFYFSPYKGLGSFKDYDPDSHAQKEIDVRVVHDLGIEKVPDGNKITFYVEDKNKLQMPIQLGQEFKSSIEQSELITLTGHICGSAFEVVNVKLIK